MDGKEARVLCGSQWSRLLGALLAIGALVISPGCNRSAPPETPAAAEPSAEQPPLAMADGGHPDAGGTASTASANRPAVNELLQRVLQRYRQANSYADQGQGRLQMVRDGQQIDELFDLALLYERPNKLRIHAYDGIYLSDGEQVRATVLGLPNQVLSTAAPAELTPADIYSDPLLAQALSGGIAGGNPQIALLLTDDFMEVIAPEGSQPQLISDGRWDDLNCWRVQVDRPDGRLVLWIDQNEELIRRIEYPVTTLQKYFQSEGNVRDVMLTVDFRNARINPPIQDVAFQFELPEEAQLVSEFDPRPLIPRPEPPAPLLGKSLTGFTFTGLDGRPISAESLAGKVTVIEFWTTDSPPCGRSLPLLEQVYRRLGNQPNVQFLAVSIDLPEVSDEQVRARANNLGVTMPVARDLQMAARDLFEVQGIPSLFVLGPDSRVQHFQLGINPQTPEQLPEIVSQLTAGGDLAAAAQQEYLRLTEQYEQEMSRAADAPREVQPSQAAEASSPSTHRQEVLWTTTEVATPGNVLSYQEPDGRWRTVIIDGWKEIVELGPGGEVAQRWTLDLPTGADVTYLRTATAANGRRWFAGFAPAQQQVYLFDANWQRLGSYPAGAEHAGVADAQLIDLSADGVPELVISYWGDRGVEALQIDGTPLWNNDQLADVFDLALHTNPGDGTPLLLCANRQGTLVPLGADGVLGEQVLLPQTFLRLLETSDLDGDGNREYCGMVLRLSGGEFAVGLSPTGEELWSYPLPSGVHAYPIEIITSGRAAPGTVDQWVLAGADGSIHLLGGDGTVIERFNYGAPLAGLATAEIGGQPVMIVASRGGDGGRVEAIRLER